VTISVHPLTDLSPDALAPLIAESELEEWRFVRRLADEWALGTNRFDRPGEVLFVARMDRSTIGVCGLNADPYTADETTGRVRRLYVLRAYRGRGVDTQLVRAVIAAATGQFQRLRVRTENPEACRLYQQLGFQLVAGVADCTHSLDLVRAKQNTAQTDPASSGPWCFSAIAGSSLITTRVTAGSKRPGFFKT
jgi:GNAT superfamily N-acetyltransferase